jgi:hypothetical protein
VSEDLATGFRTQIQAASRKLDAWIELEDFQGWDPFDALNSPLLSHLTFGNRRLGQGWVQLLKRSPLNFRPLLKVEKGYNPKGIGLFLAAYWRKYLLARQEKDLERVDRFVDWLSEHRSSGYHGACWGYNFDWPNRGFFAPAGTPTVVNTSFIGLAFCDIWKLADAAKPSQREVNALQLARSACDFIMRDLNILKPALDEICFSYTSLDSRYVHNANVLGAWLLAEVAAVTTEPELRQAALASARFTVRRQRLDGSWLYGEGPNDHWVDNFHTGYVLTALSGIQRALGSDEFDGVIRKGYDYWKANFFRADGAPKYYPNKVYPFDIHSAAQAILTFLAFSDVDLGARSNAQRMVVWAIQNMQANAGYFFYQIDRWYSIRIPYMRWSQAWMQRAFAELAWVESNENLA